MQRVIIESPWAGDIETNKRYLRACIRHCIKMGEAPFASHQMYTDSLDDLISDERRLGIDAGFKWRCVAEKTVVYTDLGISSGMQEGIADAETLGQDIEYRKLGEWR